MALDHSANFMSVIHYLLIQRAISGTIKPNSGSSLHYGPQMLVPSTSMGVVPLRSFGHPAALIKIISTQLLLSSFTLNHFINVAKFYNQSHRQDRTSEKSKMNTQTNTTNTFLLSHRSKC